MFLRFSFSRKFAKMPTTNAISERIISDLREKGFATYSSTQSKKTASIFSRKGSDDHSLTATPSDSNYAGIFNYYASFNDKDLYDVFFDWDLLAAIYNYAGGQLYYRNSPILEDHAFNGSDKLNENVKEWASLYHTDYHLQLNVMLLLDDVDDDCTSTIYAQGSNSRNIFLQGGKVDSPKSDQLIEAHKYPCVKLTGKKGDILIMDTGGFHKANFIQGSRRRMVIGILNSGFPFKGYEDDLGGFIFKDGSPDFVTNSLLPHARKNG